MILAHHDPGFCSFRLTLDRLLLVGAAQLFPHPLHLALDLPRISAGSSDLVPFSAWTARPPELSRSFGAIRPSPALLPVFFIFSPSPGLMPVRSRPGVSCRHPASPFLLVDLASAVQLLSRPPSARRAGPSLGDPRIRG